MSTLAEDLLGIPPVISLRGQSRQVVHVEEASEPISHKQSFRNRIWCSLEPGELITTEDITMQFHICKKAAGTYLRRLEAVGVLEAYSVLPRQKKGRGGRPSRVWKVL